MWIIRKDESWGIKELLNLNTWLKNDRDKKNWKTASENGVQPLKTAVELESDLITEYKNKLKIDNFPIPNAFEILHGWMEEDEGME